MRVVGLLTCGLLLLCAGRLVRAEEDDASATTTTAATTSTTEGSSTSTTSPQMAQGEKRLGDQIRAILKHYQQPDPIGLPGTPVPDPMDIPDLRNSISFYTIYMSKIKLFGLSRFRIEQIRSELALMQVWVSLSIESLDVRGVYVLSSLFTRSGGDFTVKLTNVSVQGLARLEVGHDGKLNAQDIDMDLTFHDIDINFENLGFLAGFFQSVINSVGTFIFDNIKPYVLKEVNTNIRGEVNKQISQLPNYFPNSISPFDMAVAEARKQVSDMGYDPFKVNDYTQTMGMLTITSTHTWLTGLASFYRMGNITLTIENTILYAVLDIGTQEIEGRTNWEVSAIGGVLSRFGTASFTIEYFRVQLNLSQPLDTRKRSTLEELDLELGNIQVRVDGAGTIDYIIEAGINIIPNLLRNQIMDALEGTIRRRIQDELDKVDVEKLIHEKIPDIEERAKILQGMKPVDDILLGRDHREREDGEEEEEEEAAEEEGGGGEAEDMVSPTTQASPEPDNLEPISASEEDRG
ncbi:uncharacterized protein LOC106637899 [Copidosoma floridanum]|uniref:uncharacterized protein LOC106637899 n=1 Tax=Copidosoma floridanum TaxID=29053 RepID=UPI0006C9A29C|nr:uncharacterized protein LOC106637899 [Copidosoma floridanum]